MWLVEKIRVSVERTNLTVPTVAYTFKLRDIMLGDQISSEKSKKILLCPNVITPDTIPKFCIPPKIPPQQELRSGETSKRFPAKNGRPRREASAWDLVNKHIIQVENVDETSPDNEYSDEETTNADPQSQGALSLPHLAKARTCYGFCTLLESPHTRRKESLFHSDPSDCGLPLVPPRARSSPQSRARTASSTSSLSLNTLTSRLSPRSLTLNRQGTLDSDTTSSTESSPFSSPLLARSPPKSSMFKALSHEKLLSRSLRRAMASRNDSLSTDEGSSTDNSPNVMRRASEGLVEPLPSRFGLAPPSVFSTDLVHYRDKAMRESLVPLGREGTLRLSADYCPDNQRFRVRLISAEGLYGLSVDPKSINCSVSLSLLPGKVQKQRSTVIRKSRNPIFNEDFFFDGISESELCYRSLRFKVVNKMSTMKRDYILGDCEISLTSIVTSC